MSVITAAHLGTLSDDLLFAYLRILEGSVATNLKLDAAMVDIAAETDSIMDFGRQITALKTQFGSALFARQFGPTISAMDRHCSRFGGTDYSSLQTYLTYLNINATPWQCLMDAYFYDLYLGITGRAPTANNVYFEVLQGASSVADHLYTNALGKRIVGSSFVDGVAIDTTKYAGGLPYLVWTGVTGSGIVTITGDSLNPTTGIIATGVTWLYTVSTASGSAALSTSGGTAPNNALISNVTAMSMAAGLTVGTFYVEARRPSGRSLVK